MHPSQVGSLLGIVVEPAQEAVRLGWDLHTILEAWTALVATLPWPTLLEPTPSRSRTILDLAIGSFLRVQFLPSVLQDNVFGWDATKDRSNEIAVGATLAKAEELIAFLDRIRLPWQRYLLDEEAAMTGASRTIVRTLGRGDIEYATLIAAVRNHAAQHLRQATTYLQETGRAVPTDFRVESIRDLGLPAQIY